MPASVRRNIKDAVKPPIEPFRTRQKRKKVRNYPTSLPVMPPSAPNFMALLKAGVPKILLRVVFILVVHPGVLITPNVDSVEYFAGQGELTRALRETGLVATSFEIEQNTLMDFLSPGGFALAVTTCLNLKPNALC